MASAPTARGPAVQPSTACHPAGGIAAPNRHSEVAETSALLAGAGFAHAFFTRRGGVSPAPYATLNFASSTGDRPENVEANLAVAGAWLGVPKERIYFLSQVHGTGAVRLAGDEDRREVVRVEGDATYALASGVGCGVRSADCGTILVGDRTSGAALAMHAGWRGTELGVVERGIAALREALGAPGDLVAAVGPLIEACCFEVGADVALRLAAASPLGDAAIVAGTPREDGGKARVDLRATIDAKLRALGLGAGEIDHVRGCTVCDAERWFSFRREGKTSGRLLAAIVSGRAAGAWLGPG